MAVGVFAPLTAIGQGDRPHNCATYPLSAMLAIPCQSFLQWRSNYRSEIIFKHDIFLQNEFKIILKFLRKNAMYLEEH
jgi:hypothetical protein